MSHTTVFAALAALTTIRGILAAGTPPMTFCTEGTCNGDGTKDSCPASITTAGAGYPACVVYDTDTVLEAGNFAAATGGGYSLWVDVPEPDAGCQVIVKFPAATTLQACGTVVGAFEHATCQAMTFRDTFMMQSCCGSDDCKAAGVGKKMIRGMDWKRTAGATGVTLTFANGSVIEPLEIGNPPELNAKSKRAFEPAPLFVRDDPDTSDSSCTSWTPDSDLLKDYTRPADAVQIVATGVNGGTSGGTTTISTARTVEWSISVTTGVDLEIVKAETTIEFSQSITDTKTKTWTVPAGEVGKVGFTPTLRCSQGKCGGSGSSGEVCTGYREGDEIAGTYAVIAVS